MFNNGFTTSELDLQTYLTDNVLLCLFVFMYTFKYNLLKKKLKYKHHLVSMKAKSTASASSPLQRQAAFYGIHKTVDVSKTK